MKLARTTIAVVLCLALAGCIDKIIAGLNIGAAVLNAAAGTKGLDAKLAADLRKVSKVIGDVTSAYDDYEKAEAGLKEGKLSTLEAAITTAQADLGTILSDVGVKNPELVEYITVAVAVANSAILALTAKLPAPSSARVTLARSNRKPLPVVPGAKNASDLKKAWNAKAREAGHPEAVVQ